MRDRDGYSPGVPCWVDTSQPDPDAAARFYGALFGWTFQDRTPPGAPGRYLVAALGGRAVAAVGSQPEGSAGAAPMWTTYVWVESAHETAAKAVDAGGRVLTEAFDVGDAGRMGVLADPTGAVVCTWQAGTNRGAQAVNVPGSWNWSTLNTPDVDACLAFYGAVFGWEGTRLEFDDVETVMLRLPGYADALEALDPGIRDRHADAGAPEAFSDAVAWMAPAGGDVTPHWSVTFAVDGTDEIAERAVRLGGRIVVEPHDAGPTRVATLSDPQGATIEVSTYTPDAPDD